MARMNVKRLIEAADNATTNYRESPTDENLKRANEAIANLEQHVQQLNATEKKQFEEAIKRADAALKAVEKNTEQFLNHSSVNQVTQSDVDDLIAQVEKEVSLELAERLPSVPSTDPAAKLSQPQKVTRVQKSPGQVPNSPVQQSKKAPSVEEIKTRFAKLGQPEQQQIGEKIVSKINAKIEKTIEQYAVAIEAANSQIEAENIHAQTQQLVENTQKRIQTTNQGKEIQLPFCTISGPPVDKLDRNLQKVDAWLKQTAKDIAQWTGEKTKAAIKAGAKLVVKSLASIAKGLTSLLPGGSSAKKEDAMLSNVKQADIDTGKSKSPDNPPITPTFKK